MKPTYTIILRKVVDGFEVCALKHRGDNTGAVFRADSLEEALEGLRVAVKEWRKGDRLGVKVPEPSERTVELVTNIPTVSLPRILGIKTLEGFA